MCLTAAAPPSARRASNGSMARCHRLKSDPDLGYTYNPRTMRMRTAGDRGVRNQLDEDLVDTSLDLAWTSPPAGTEWVEDRGVRRDYDADARAWTASPIRLLVASEPFAQGGLRLAYRGRELVAESAADGARAATVDVARRPWAEHGVVAAPGLTYELVGAADDDDAAASEESPTPRGAIDVVIKQWAEPGAAPERTFGEVAAQAVAARCARRFNDACAARGLATRVSFARACVLELDGYPEPLACEPCLPGAFVKHTDNLGHECGAPTLGEGLCLSCCGCLEASATLSDIALAFSYFTWADSGGALVVCDIQGVGLCFTDPQIHTADGRGFGLGNLGQSGIDRFLKGYRHGPMARRLGLHARKRAVAAPAAPSELLFPSVIAPPDAKKPMTSIRVSLEEESDGAARGALAPLSEVDASERIAA